MKRMEPILKPLNRLGHNMRTTGDMQAYTPVSASFSEFSERIIERLLKREIGAWRRFSLYYLEEAQALPEQSPEKNLTQPGVLKLSMLFQVYRQAAVSTHTLSLAPAVFLTRPAGTPQPTLTAAAHRRTESRIFRELETKPGESRTVTVQIPGEREEERAITQHISQPVYREPEGRLSTASRQESETGAERGQAHNQSVGVIAATEKADSRGTESNLPAAALSEGAQAGTLAAGEAAQVASGRGPIVLNRRAAAMSPLRMMVSLSPFLLDGHYHSPRLWTHFAGQDGMGWRGTAVPGYTGNDHIGDVFHVWEFAGYDGVDAATGEPGVSEAYKEITGRYETRYLRPWEMRLDQTFYTQPVQADGAPEETGVLERGIGPAAGSIWRFNQQRHINSLFARITRLMAIGFPGRSGAAGASGRPGAFGPMGVSGSAGIPGSAGIIGSSGAPGAQTAYSAPYAPPFERQSATAARYDVHYLTPWEAQPVPTMYMQPGDVPAAKPTEASPRLSPEALRLRWERQVQSLFTRIERLTGFSAPGHTVPQISGVPSQSFERIAARSTQNLIRAVETGIKELLPAGVDFKTGDVSSREELARTAAQMAARRQPLSAAQRQSLNRLLERAYPGAAAHIAARVAPQNGRSAASSAEIILDVFVQDALNERAAGVPRRQAGRGSPALNADGALPSAARAMPYVWRRSPVAASEGRMESLRRRYMGASRLRAGALEPLAARWAVKTLDVWSFRPAQMTLNLNPVMDSEGSWTAETPLPQERRMHRSDTILRRFLRHDRLDWLSRTVEQRANRALKRYVTEPARLIRFVPAAYINQYGRLQPIGGTDWTGYGYHGDGTPPAALGSLAQRQVVYREDTPASRREQEAQQFFQDVSRLFGGPSGSAAAMGRVAGPGMPMIRPPEISYKQNENDATGRLVSQQRNQPRSLNQPLKTQRELKIQGDAEMDEREIIRVADRVFDKIERRIQNERRRFGL